MTCWPKKTDIPLLTDPDHFSPLWSRSLFSSHMIRVPGRSHFPPTVFDTINLNADPDHFLTWFLTQVTILLQSLYTAPYWPGHSSPHWRLSFFFSQWPGSLFSQWNAGHYSPSVLGQITTLGYSASLCVSVWWAWVIIWISFRHIGVHQANSQAVVAQPACQNIEGGGGERERRK